MTIPCMKIYLVRHGESEGNVQFIIQPPESPLSDIGHAQGKIVAHRFKTIPIDTIISSINPRAYDTAQYISQATGKEIIGTDLLREHKKPTEMIGLRADDDVVKSINQESLTHADDPQWHYSDEENFFDIIKRVDETLKFLANRPEENLCVVSHSGYIRPMLWRMLQPSTFYPLQYFDFHHALRTSNAGISVCEYKNGRWRVLTINDDAHLG